VTFTVHFLPTHTYVLVLYVLTPLCKVPRGCLKPDKGDYYHYYHIIILSYYHIIIPFIEAWKGFGRNELLIAISTWDFWGAGGGGNINGEHFSFFISASRSTHTLIQSYSYPKSASRLLSFRCIQHDASPSPSAYKRLHARCPDHNLSKPAGREQSKRTLWALCLIWMRSRRS